MVENITVKQAMDVIRQSMINDNPSEPGSYAHSWHCNIAMMCYDAIHDADKQAITETNHEWAHKVGNDAASRFMKLCFDVETKD